MASASRAVFIRPDAGGAFLAGVGTVAATVLLIWPASTLLLVDAVYHLNLGETVPWRQAFFATSWRRWEFWMFSAIMSWALIPVVEEFFFRGYCQRRLAEDWGDAPAIIGTACLFTFTHSQYLTPNAYNLCMVVSLFVLAIAFGTVFAWTRSLIPAMFAHSIVDIPMTPHWQVLFLIAFLIGGLVWRKPAVAAARQVFTRASVPVCVALGVFGTGWAIASQRIERLVFLAVAMVVIAVVLETVERRQARTAGSAGA